jgi:hypothetical protein
VEGLEFNDACACRANKTGHSECFFTVANSWENFPASGEIFRAAEKKKAGPLIEH